MKKKFIFYIIILLLISNLIFYFSTISFERNKLDKLIKTKETELENLLEREAKDYVKGFYSGDNIFFTHDKAIFEDDMHNINMLTKTRNRWSSGELQYIIEGTNFNNIYFVDSNGHIKFSSNENAENKNITNIFGSIAHKVMKKNLAKGEFINAEIIPRITDGELVLMSYYSPKYSSYMLFIEVNFIEYLKKHYSREFESTSLIRNAFNYGTAEYVVNIDIYYDEEPNWSVFNTGNSLNSILNNEEILELKKQGVYKKENKINKSYFKANPEKYKFSKLKRIEIKKDIYDFSIILKIEYNFINQVEYINNSLNRVLKLGLVLLIISIVISSLLFSIFVESKLLLLIEVLKKIKKGKYTVEDIKLRGKDELTDIAETVNKLKKEVLIREKKLIKVAITDELTKLYNRKYLFHRLNEEVDKSDRYNSNFSIVLLDIDHFKKINDTFGHQIGDEVLAEMGKTLLKQLRKSDIAARYGGEEFMLVLPQTNLDAAYKMVERLRKQLENKSWNIDGLKVTISSGVKEYNIKSELDPFIAEVDELLYKAKNNGRNRTEI